MLLSPFRITCSTSFGPARVSYLGTFLSSKWTATTTNWKGTALFLSAKRAGVYSASVDGGVKLTLSMFFLASYTSVVSTLHGFIRYFCFLQPPPRKRSGGRFMIVLSYCVLDLFLFPFFSFSFLLFIPYLSMYRTLFQMRIPKANHLFCFFKLPILFYVHILVTFSSSTRLFASLWLVECEIKVEGGSVCFGFSLSLTVGEGRTLNMSPFWNGILVAVVLLCVCTWSVRWTR